jgi:hypothetical protein
MTHEVGKCNVCGNPSTIITRVFKDRSVCKDCYIRIAKVVEVESKSMDQQIVVLEDVVIENDLGGVVLCHHCNGGVFGSTSLANTFVCRTCNTVVNYDGGGENE